MPEPGNPVSDTRPEAAEVQRRVLRGLTGAERVEIAFEMSMLVRDLAATRLRQQHPDWSEADVRRELLRYAFSPHPLPDPLR
jgi:hypothetical protein